MPSRSIVVVSGGLSQPSSTRMLADRLAEATVADLAARGLDAVLEVVELRGLAHDVVDMTLTGYARPELAAAQSALAGADGVIAVTPVFAASYAGLFKSFVDVLEPGTLDGTPVLLGATGGTPRHSLALDHALRPLFAYLRADVAPTAVFAATDDWADAGTDDVQPLPARVRRAAAELAQRVAAREPVARGGLYDSVPSFEDLLGGA
ncbi:CE1759 family FMN reductase [Cellulomonas wangsupingiae]|uniref:NAD(P)H-dependent oxidoreductase n=1 Tax=Cellulomonas wangsupingiae TaxID=2968085 RepID=A0ABY5K5C6_9CELL|nr:CE1759 family FMN reductase [Cellulomonas wangsupingiae]MCC2335469.1 NAD(P)H-dependent oxidoreductase [Cellulomonas wangsupingiae]MCM0640001.1 NAD(P)H-dependent oxidoreductase [Cellulomonas wangsupingiae]UUI64357.1 NAD(P)H-dependent oxidoreductase [Cellulomonas wangsupingiae]